MDALKLIAADSLKENKPVIAIGDTVRVDVKIREGDPVKESQAFEGTVIAKRGSGCDPRTFTVRRVSIRRPAWSVCSRCIPRMLPRLR